MEKDRASHMNCLADMYYGLPLEKCKQLEYKFAELFGILGIRIKKLANSGGLASRTDTTWPSDLLKQHQLAMLRHSTNTQEYFENLSNVLLLAKHQFTPDRI